MDTNDLCITMTVFPVFPHFIFSEKSEVRVTIDIFYYSCVTVVKKITVGASTELFGYNNNAFCHEDDGNVVVRQTVNRVRIIEIVICF